MSGVKYKIGHIGRMVVSKPAWSASVEKSMREALRLLSRGAFLHIEWDIMDEYPPKTQ
jgi:hypothetical protein